MTEKWKKGELPEGWYYVKDEDGQIIIAEYSIYCIDRETNETEGDWSCDSEPEQVLKRVPSYDEWQEYKDANDSMFDTIKMLNKDNYKLEKKNTKLKELLKECKGLLSCLQIDDYDDNGLLVLSKINQVLGEE